MNLPVKSFSTPLFKMLAQQLINAIENGSLIAGASLPPSRELAETLQLSRDTVVKAYEYLASLGYIETSRTRGTFVKRRLLEFAPQAAASCKQTDSGEVAKLSDYGTRLLGANCQNSNVKDQAVLNFGAPAAQFLPVRLWRELMQKQSQPSLLRYEPHALGLLELRQALASFLNRGRGISAAADQIAVFSQSQNALNLLVSLLTNPGDSVVVEDPGFSGIRIVAEAQGLRLLPCPVDCEGININNLAQSDKIKLIYITPAHHDPSGAVMSAARRKRILEFAHEHKAWIIEDDYDSYIDYASSAQPALKAMEPEGNVIYLSNFWKTLYPLTAIGFCVFPKAIAEALARAKTLSDPCSNALEQLVLAKMLAEGHLEIHNSRIKKEYKLRRRIFVSLIKRYFGSLVDVPKESGAMQYLVRFTGPFASSTADKIILDAGKSAGLSLISSAYAYFKTGNAGEFIFDFTSLDEESMTRAMAIFAADVKQKIAYTHSPEQFYTLRPAVLSLS